MSFEDSLAAPPAVLRQPPGLTLLLGGVSAAFLAGSLLLVRQKGAENIGWFGVIMAGLMTLSFAAILIRPARLELTPQGFRYGTLGRLRTYRWSQSDNFRVVQNRFFYQILWDYRVDGAPEDRSRVLLMNGDWRMPPWKVVDLLTQAKARWSPRENSPRA